MCALVNDANEVLLIKRNSSWKGWAFPGGHLEASESLEACVKREIYEETNLKLKSVIFKGVVHFFNTISLDRYFVYSYYSDDFFGEYKENCSEGLLKWFPVDALERIDLAEGLESRLDVFWGQDARELYIEWNENDGYTKIEKNLMKG